MFLKSLRIENNGTIIREIPFHKGLNLIIDETRTENLQETGNNVGKTTVLRLIDFCFGGDGKNIYRDPEFPDKSNNQVEAFLTKNNIIITLILKEDLEIESSREITIKRNFLKYRERIQEINGKPYNRYEFDAKLKELIFETLVEKPTFRQIVSKNIRDDKNRLINTIKVLHPTTTFEEYEALYFFWFGIDLDSSSRKQKLTESKKIEERVLQRLKKEFSESEILQALEIINHDIDELNNLKNSFNLNENYEKDIEELNNIKSRLNHISTQIGRLSIRRELILESKRDLETEFVEIDTKQLENIYKSAKSFIPDLQTSYNDLVKFHNNMLKEKIRFITNELPELENLINKLNSELTILTKSEKDLSIKLKKTGAIEELEAIINKLNIKYEQKGKYEEQLRQWNNSNGNLKKIENELKEINEGIESLDSLFDKRIKSFNHFFSKLSERFYGEQFILSYDKNDRAYELKIGSIGGNLGTGKKKGQIAAFDFAYIQFCEENDMKCLHFILHDQIENIHDNQLKILAEVANEINSQLILPVLQDKLPKDINPKLYKVESLSQDDKLFRI